MTVAPATPPRLGTGARRGYLPRRPNRLDWQNEGACLREPDADLFFPADNQPDDIADAKQVCSGCPVREICLVYAIEHGEQYGIWGGADPDERRALARHINRGAA